MINGQSPFGGSDERSGSAKTADNLPLSTVLGSIKSSAPEFTLRTRIWASLRAQTFYRTVSVIMNHAKAIKLLYRVENPKVLQLFGRDTDKLERELERMTRKKFKFVSYLDEEPSQHESGGTRLFSALINGQTELIAETGRRRPKFRIELPGNPILGNDFVVDYRKYLWWMPCNNAWSQVFVLESRAFDSKAVVHTSSFNSTHFTIKSKINDWLVGKGERRGEDGNEGDEKIPLRK
ncbi:1,3-beta-glucan synthase [Pyrrhoderma noxium]|uniref:1,3-beta-glucan synthase n=1 Tax=Pyrrhoderma noxium TaxID=2282107 RepID=A0A286UFC0_9AGAM|nr:1,3-beta-glucan synthase [Pyrrhoderma noxium]